MSTGAGQFFKILIVNFELQAGRQECWLVPRDGTSRQHRLQQWTFPVMWSGSHTISSFRPLPSRWHVCKDTVNRKTSNIIHIKNMCLFVFVFRWSASMCSWRHSEKSPARPMLFDSTNYWQQFWVQFVVKFNSHITYCTSIKHYMMGNMTVKLPHIRQYFSYSVSCY